MRMIGGSTRLSTLVIDANKSWEEKQLTNVVLTPSLITSSDFSNAPILNMCMPYNNEILLISYTETFSVGVALTVLKSFALYGLGRYRVQFKVRVESAEHAGNVLFQINDVTKQSWLSLENTTYYTYQTDIYTALANQLLQIKVYGSTITAKIYIETTLLLGAAFNKSPIIFLE